MLSTYQDSGPGVTALVQILFLGHCIQVQKSVFLALYRARKITLSFSFPQTMWKLILVHLRGRKHFCIWVEKCFPPLRCTPTSVFYMVWGKKEYKVIFLALYNARKTTFCTWVWCLLSKWWVRKNIFPISYILKKVLTNVQKLDVPGPDEKFCLCWLCAFTKFSSGGAIFLVHLIFEHL